MYGIEDIDDLFPYPAINIDSIRFLFYKQEIDKQFRNEQKII
jgi:hypothetical protein